MIARIFFLIALASLACAQVGSVNVAQAVTTAPMQRPGFITVEGANLSDRMGAAIRLGRAAGARYWTAYTFDARPGVSVDIDWNGKRTGTNVSFDSTRETRNLGVFLLREPNDTAVTRVEVYNLDRDREYGGYRVYWLGRAGNEESLNLLRELVENHNYRTAARVGEHATMAIALHDDARVAGMLKNFARQSSNEKARMSAVFWLGNIGGETPFLADLARNESERLEVRKQAVFAIGISKDSGAISTLQTLYPSVTNRDVKEQIIFAASINEDKDAAVNFLIDISGKDNDHEARKKAIFWLGQKAGERSLNALKDTLESSAADTEIQKHAVFGISQRPKDESIPLLINIAKTHANPDVRKQAIFWLGQTGDQRAVDFFKEILTK